MSALEKTGLRILPIENSDLDTELSAKSGSGMRGEPGSCHE